MHHGHEEDEIGAVVDAGVGQEEAVDVCGTVGERVAEGGETGVDVVPAHVAEDGGVAVALVPDVAFERLTPVIQRVAWGGIGGAALEEGRKQDERETGGGLAGKASRTRGRKTRGAGAELKREVHGACGAVHCGVVDVMAWERSG